MLHITNVRVLIQKCVCVLVVTIQLAIGLNPACASHMQSKMQFVYNNIGVAKFQLIPALGWLKSQTVKSGQVLDLLESLLRRYWVDIPESKFLP